MSERMVIIVNNGTPDRLLGMAVLVSGAVALDMEVDIYLMLWGVYAFKKDVVEKNKELIEHKDLAPQVEEGLKGAGLKPWYEMLKELKEMGTVRIHACGAALKAWNATKDDLILVDDVIGATEMVTAAKEANVALFI